MQDTTPEEILWSFRDRLRSKLADANEANCEIVRNLDSDEGVKRVIQNQDGFVYLIEPGGIYPVDGFEGGGVFADCRVMRINVEIQRIDVVDLPFTGDDLLSELGRNVYAKAAQVVHAIGTEPLKQREGDEEITFEIPAKEIDFFSDGNRKAIVRIPFDIQFGWDLDRHNPRPE